MSITTSTTVADFVATFKRQHQLGVDAFDNVWQNFFQNYLGADEHLHASLLREMFIWYGNVTGLRNRLFLAFNVQGYSSLTKSFLDEVFAITPVTAARLGEQVKSLAPEARDIVGDELTFDHVLAFHMLWGCFHVLRSVEIRLTSNSLNKEDVSLLEGADLIRFFMLAGAFMRAADGEVTV